MSARAMIPPTLVLPPQSDWPQWRGVDGMAVARGAKLPTLLGADSPELRWKAAVPGEGASSPIVQGERVFLTTAFPSETGNATLALRVGIPVAGALALALLLARRPLDAQLRRSPLARLDGLALALGTLAVVALACVLAFRLDVALGKPLWEPGAPGYRWFWTSAVALAGSAVALCWFRPGSALRPLGALALLVVAWLLFRDMPPNKFRSAFKLEVRLAMIAPALAGAAWHLLVFAAARGAQAVRGPLAAGLGAGALLAAAWGAFALTNRVALATGIERAVACYDLASGAHLWTTTLFVTGEEPKYEKNTYATPTPCATPEVVFAHFGAGYGGLDHAGKVLWTEIDPDWHLETRYGAAASPVLAGDSVIYLHDKEAGLGPSYVTRIDLATGKTLWYAETEDANDSYTTPLLVERGAGQEILSVTCDELRAYDARDGKKLWGIPIPIQQMVPGLQIRGDLLLASGGTHAGYSTSGVRLSGSGKDTRAEIAWQTKRATPGISSPVLVDDCFYTITQDGGILTCFAPETGEVRYQERLGGSYWSSLVAGDGKLYALDHDGATTTIRAGPAFEVLARGELGALCHATPAIAGSRIVVRTEKDLWCFEAGEKIDPR